VCVVCSVKRVATVLWTSLLPPPRPHRCGNNAPAEAMYKKIVCVRACLALPAHTIIMFIKLADFDLEKDYAAPYTSSRDTYLKAAAALKLATGPYKAARDAYVAATATYTKSLYE
jgi:hypothetical protein